MYINSDEQGDDIVAQLTNNIMCCLFPKRSQNLMKVNYSRMNEQRIVSLNENNAEVEIK